MLLFNDEELGSTQSTSPHRQRFLIVGSSVTTTSATTIVMPNINAALGCAQLEKLDKYVASKRKVAAEYIEHFKNVDGIDFFAEPRTHSPTTGSLQLY